MRRTGHGWGKTLILAAALAIGGLLAGLSLYGVRPLRTETAARSAPIQLEDGRKASRIAMLGTSLTARGDWVSALQGELGECNPDARITALARPGANSSWGLETLLTRQERFDIVVVEFSTNDASLYHGMPLFRSRQRHAEIIDAIRATGAVPVLAAMSPAWGREAWERPGQASYRQMYRDLALNEGIAVIDTTAGWSALPAKDRADLVPDNLHPTPEAMRKVAIPAFLAALRPAVCESSG